jgi:hypothetical protein
MRIYGEIPKVRGVVVLITRSQFRDQERLDIREFVEDRPGTPDSRQPTRKGVNLPLAKLPALVAALQAAAGEALEAGNLKPADFHKAGLSVPDTERKAA